MTNREWLHSLPDDKLIAYIGMSCDWCDVKSQDCPRTDCRKKGIEWLNKEVTENEIFWR